MSARGDHCLFRSRGTDFAFPTETAKEILEKRSYTEIPRGPAGLLGALNLRGEILPLISLAKFLHGLPLAEEHPANLLILADGDLRVAAGVDEVLAVQHFPPWEIHPATANELHISPASVRGVVSRGESRTIILDGSLFLREVAASIRTGFAPTRSDEKGESWPDQKD